MTNDIHKQQSEPLKADFVHLFTTLKKSMSHIPMSGLIPSYGLGCGRFSHLLALHIWLSSACAAHSVSYIDNFNLFWNHRELFKGDCINPNWLGAKLLSGNISYSVLLTGKQNNSLLLPPDQSHLDLCPLGPSTCVTGSSPYVDHVEPGSHQSPTNSLTHETAVKMKINKCSLAPFPHYSMDTTRSRSNTNSSQLSSSPFLLHSAPSCGHLWTSNTPESIPVLKINRRTTQRI